MNKKYCIYLHRNKLNGKCYVGQTCESDPINRWRIDGSGYKTQPCFYRAIIKYGWDNFEHIILEKDLTAEAANEKECYWGGYYHALAPEGYCLHLGKTVQNKKSIVNRSIVLKQKWEVDLQYKQKVSQGQKNKWKNWSTATQEKVLKNIMPRHAVRCIETQIVYPSMREAQRQTGINYTHISQVCKGTRTTAGGFHWESVK